MMFKISFFIAIVVAQCFAHSMMQCANFDEATGKCLAPIRNSGQSKIVQSYRFNQNPSQACQAPFASPLSSYYSSGSSCASWAGCPDPMGTVAAGSTFNVMWYARNHAVANQGPGNVVMYLSPKVAQSTTSDPSENVFKQNKICEGSYMNCPGGNGDSAQCYLKCTMPQNIAEGTYTLWWYWNWSNNDGNIYTTCADLTVTGSSGSGSGSATSTSGTSTSTSGTSTSTSTSGTSTSTSGTSGSTSGSTSGGSGSTGDFAVIARGPITIPQRGLFNVTIGYKAPAGRDLVIDVLDSVNYSWYGKGVTTVATGKGGATVTVTIQNNPQIGSNYLLNLWVVDAGKADQPNAWMSSYENQQVKVSVGASLVYNEAC